MRLKLLIAVLVLSAIGYIAAYLYVQASQTAKMATTISRLGEIRGRLLQYQQNHGAFPSEGLADLGLSPHELQDPITGLPFSYRPKSESAGDRPIVEQISAFRTKLWPFGEVRRYVLYANGDISDAQNDGSTVFRGISSNGNK